MTERFEVTTALQRELVNDAAVSGGIGPGTRDQPAVYMESVHHLLKLVAGAPNIRPAWFFDTSQQGEGLNDIGTHLVDLVQWTLYPNQAIDYRQDVKVMSAQRWPTPISEVNFKRVTGGQPFPASVLARVENGTLQYDCNTLVSYSVRGTNVTLNVIWDWEPPAGAGDRHYAIYRGRKAAVEIRQTKADNYLPELSVIPNQASDALALLAAVNARLKALGASFDGVTAEMKDGRIHVAIPARYRVGHEAHFAQVTRNFLSYLQDRSKLPTWERPNMLAKYYVTTTGTELSHQSPVKSAPRLAPE
jgi:predicted dehydrogenase